MKCEGQNIIKDNDNALTRIEIRAELIRTVLDRTELNWTRGDGMRYLNLGSSNSRPWIQ